MLMKLCLCFGICLSSKWFHLRLTFFPFLKPWADNSSANQYSYHLLYGRGMIHLVPSYLKNAYCGRGASETPSALRCLFYLINSFLTGITWLKTSSGSDLCQNNSYQAAKCWLMILTLLRG